PRHHRSPPNYPFISPVRLPSLLQRFQSGLGPAHTASQRLTVEFARLGDVALSTEGLPRRQEEWIVCLRQPEQGLCAAHLCRPVEHVPRCADVALLQQEVGAGYQANGLRAALLEAR